MLEGANIKIFGTITDINGKSAKCILEYILTGKQIDSSEYDILCEKKVIVHNLKATKEQIIDDLNGVMSELQRKMMRILLDHLDELNGHIKALDDDMDRHGTFCDRWAYIFLLDLSSLGLLLTYLGLQKRRTQKWLRYFHVQASAGYRIEDIPPGTGSLLWSFFMVRALSWK